MKHYNELYTTYLQPWTFAYYLEMKLFLGSRFDFYCTLHDDDDINHWNLYTRLVIQVMAIKTVFSPEVAIFDVCIY